MAGKQSFFAGVDEADVFDQGRYLPAGFAGIVEIERCLIKESRNSGDGFIAEIKVLTSNMPDVQGLYGWWQSLGKDWSLPALKAFVIGIFAIQKDNPEGKKKVWNRTLDPLIQGVLDRAVDTENLLCGMKVRVETSGRKTGEGGDFTRHDWSAVEGHPDFLTIARSPVKALGAPPGPAPVRQQFNGIWYVLVNNAWQIEPAAPPPFVPPPAPYAPPPPPAPYAAPPPPPPALYPPPPAPPPPPPADRQQFHGRWYRLVNGSWVPE